MILDERLELADAAALDTSGTGRKLFGDVIDLGVVGAGTSAVQVYPGDVGLSALAEQMALVFQVTTAITGTTSTVSLEVVTDAQAAISVDGSATEHAVTEAIPEATLVAGYTRKLPLAAEVPQYERYLGLITNIGVNVLTAGAANAFLTRDVGSWKAYPDAV